MVRSQNKTQNRYSGLIARPVCLFTLDVHIESEEVVNRANIILSRLATTWDTSVNSAASGTRRSLGQPNVKYMLAIAM